MKIEQILNFDFTKEEFVLSADFVITDAMNRTNIRLKKELAKLQTEYESRETDPLPNIMHAFLKFKAGYKNNMLNEFIQDTHLYRKLAYCFVIDEQYPMIIESTDETKKAIEILNSRWKDSFIIGLTASMLDGWEKGDRKALDYLRGFIIKKLEAYSGKRKIIEDIRKNAIYFCNPEGPAKLGLELFYKNVPLKDAPEYLSLPKNWITYSYFSPVITAYFEKAKKDRIRGYKELLFILDEHKNQITDKRILSQMLVDLAADPSEELIEKVKLAAYKKIGDPGIISSWVAPKSFSTEEQEILEKARLILNQWLIREFIDVFFDVCINDQYRKAFWQKQVVLISDFRVIGSKYMRMRLNQNSRIAKFMGSKFQSTSGIQDIAAIMLVINNHLFIEFSDTGFACIAYKRSNPSCPKLNDVICNVSDLRTSKLEFIRQEMFNYNYFPNEGKFRHSGSWENNIESFILKVVSKEISTIQIRNIDIITDFEKNVEFINDDSKQEEEFENNANKGFNKDLLSANSSYVFNFLKNLDLLDKTQLIDSDENFRTCHYQIFSMGKHFWDQIIQHKGFHLLHSTQIEYAKKIVEKIIKDKVLSDMEILKGIEILKIFQNIDFKTTDRSLLDVMKNVKTENIKSTLSVDCYLFFKSISRDDQKEYIELAGEYDENRAKVISKAFENINNGYRNYRNFKGAKQIIDQIFKR